MSARLLLGAAFKGTGFPRCPSFVSAMDLAKLLGQTFGRPSDPLPSLFKFFLFPLFFFSFVRRDPRGSIYSSVVIETHDGIQASSSFLIPCGLLSLRNGSDSAGRSVPIGVLDHLISIGQLFSRTSLYDPSHDDLQKCTRQLAR